MRGSVTTKETVEFGRIAEEGFEMGPFRCNLFLLGGASPHCLGGLETFEGGGRATTVVSLLSTTEVREEELHSRRMENRSRLRMMFVGTQIFAGDGKKGRVKVGEVGGPEALNGGRDGLVTFGKAFKEGLVFQTAKGREETLIAGSRRGGRGRRRRRRRRRRRKGASS